MRGADPNALTGPRRGRGSDEFERQPKKTLRPLRLCGFLSTVASLFVSFSERLH
jgi:hypothetical protein